MQAITSKRQMYSLLASGQLGNTTAQYFSLSEWEASSEYRRYDVWGVRTLRPGGPCRLYCPRCEVAETVKRFGETVNISMMLDAVFTVHLWANICEPTDGLLPGELFVNCIEYPPHGASWRELMPKQSSSLHGIQARMMLRKHLNENSLDDLRVLLDEYPGHVVELSAIDACVGTVPHRNAIIWEVRQY